VITLCLLQLHNTWTFRAKERIQRSLKLGFRFCLAVLPDGRLSSHPQKLDCFDRMNTDRARLNLKQH